MSEVLHQQLLATIDELNVLLQKKEQELLDQRSEEEQRQEDLHRWAAQHQAELHDRFTRQTDRYERMFHQQHVDHERQLAESERRFQQQQADHERQQAKSAAVALQSRELLDECLDLESKDSDDRTMINALQSENDHLHLQLRQLRYQLAAPAPAPAQQKQKTCKFFQRGNCSKGVDCKFPHV
jgi:hypothetical protein